MNYLIGLGFMCASFGGGACGILALCAALTGQFALAGVAIGLMSSGLVIAGRLSLP